MQLKRQENLELGRITIYVKAFELMISS